MIAPVFRRLMYSPFLVQLVVTRKCNLTCTYCNEFDQVSEPVPLEVLKARIDMIRELGAYSLEFTGGEPMLHPDIYELIRYARTKRFVKVMMISNAYLFNEEKVRKLNAAGLQELQISVDGVRPNAVTVKVLNPMKPKLKLVAQHARFKVVLSGVLGAAPANEVLEVVEYAKDAGFRPRVLVLHDGDGQLKLDDDEREMFDRVKRALGEKRFREAGDYRDKLLATGHAPFRCRAGSRYLYVDEFGKVSWCSQTRDDFAVPLEDYDHAQLKRQFNTVKSCAPGCTVGCARTQSAFDEWRPQKLKPKVRLPLAV